MRKIAFIASALFISLITVTNADGFDQIAKFPIKLWIFGQEKQFPEDLEVYNINGTAYVPLRAFAQHLGNEVFYIEQTRKILISKLPSPEKVSSVSSLHRAEDFALDLHSEKTVYSTNDIINVWSNLSYQGGIKTTIYHGTPVITFTITDEHGIRGGGYIAQSRSANYLTNGNQIGNTFPISSILEYNFRKSGIPNYQDFLDKTPNAAYLPPGKYKVTAQTEFTKENSKDQISLNTSIEFTVSD